jgi:hypothetical protein
MDFSWLDFAGKLLFTTSPRLLRHFMVKGRLPRMRPTLLSKKTVHRQLERKWIECDVCRNLLWKWGCFFLNTFFFLSVFWFFVAYRDPPEKILLLTEATSPVI